MSDSTPKPHPDPEIRAILKELPGAEKAGTDGFEVKDSDGQSEKVVDAIEMIGEETAAGMRHPDEPTITPGMRYLHISRTIHQLVTDRNRAVGIYLAVASLLMTASGAIFNANPKGDLIVPIEKVQRWCLPITFATLTLLAVFIAFLLIRTRAGLIYEVAKMNALLGLPVGRVQRLSPLSIFFIMQGMISLGGGLTAGLFTVYMLYLGDPHTEKSLWPALLVGSLVSIGLMLLYILTVNHITSDKRLEQVGK